MNSKTMMDRSSRTPPNDSGGMSRRSSFTGGSACSPAWRSSALESRRFPVSREGPDELDDDSSDQQEPENEEDEPEHLEYGHPPTLPDKDGSIKTETPGAR